MRVLITLPIPHTDTPSLSLTRWLNELCLNEVQSSQELKHTIMIKKKWLGLGPGCSGSFKPWQFENEKNDLAAWLHDSLHLNHI